MLPARTPKPVGVADPDQDPLAKRLKDLRKQTRSINFVDGVQITGGLVIPYYFMLLAVFGGIVNLARNIPEYHRRALIGRDADLTETEAALDPRKAREYLIFQVLQLFSAPFIASFAYTLVLPEQFATSAMLGFASGFASQPYNGSPWRISRRAPLVGEHNQEVFCKELGLQLAELAYLTEAGVL